MTDTNSQPAAQSQPQPQAQPPRRRRRWLLGLGLVLVAAVAGGIAGKVTSLRHHAYAFGPGYGHAHGFAGPVDPARIEERADRIVRRVVTEVDATYEQQDKLRAIVKAAVKDLVPLAEKAQFARREGRALLTNPSLDRAMIEKFRAEQMALADTFSKRLAQAIADANEVLTAEQRRRIADLLPPQRGRWGGWHRG